VAHNDALALVTLADMLVKEGFRVETPHTGQEPIGRG